MAHPEHLEKLKGGIEGWNEWRASDPRIRPDLSGADLSRANLRGADLSGADFEGASLRGTNLHHANLEWAILMRADFRGAVLKRVNLALANLTGARPVGADIIKAKLHGAIMDDVDWGMLTKEYRLFGYEEGMIRRVRRHWHEIVLRNTLPLADLRPIQITFTLHADGDITDLTVTGPDAGERVLASGREALLAAVPFRS
jgi:uncharacterized protein YjbI with pentapeptide repeats